MLQCRAIGVNIIGKIMSSCTLLDWLGEVSLKLIMAVYSSSCRTGWYASTYQVFYVWLCTDVCSVLGWVVLYQTTWCSCWLLLLLWVLSLFRIPITNGKLNMGTWQVSGNRTLPLHNHAAFLCQCMAADSTFFPFLGLFVLFFGGEEGRYWWCCKDFVHMMDFLFVLSFTMGFQLSI